MLVKTQEQMDNIVSNNKDLSWDGWTVVSLTPTDSGTMSKDGIRIKGKWFLQKRFELTAIGWEIPNKLIG